MGGEQYKKRANVILSAIIGVYSAQHSEKVSCLVLYAPLRRPPGHVVHRGVFQSCRPKPGERITPAPIEIFRSPCGRQPQQKQ
jgi:hypothetical protein